MPELPEVETVCRGLAQVLTGRRITTVNVRRRDLRVPVPEDFTQVLQGRVVEAVSRRAKYALVHLSGGWRWVVHLGMSGQVIVHEREPELKTHDHVIVGFGSGQAMVYTDPRRFGMMLALREEEMAGHPLFSHLGPEPLSDEFTAKYLKQAFARRSMAVKPALMDQETVVGVGNIYASEALFRAGIHPDAPANTLSFKALERLVPAIQEVLTAAIASGGSTLRDYVRSTGDMGYFQHQFNVYDRKDEPCVVCGTGISASRHAGRSTYFCGKCQI